MLTIDLEPELENTLKTLAEQQHISVNTMINRLLIASLKEEKILSDTEQKQQRLLHKIRNITPVKCQYSTEQIVRSLRDGTVLGE